MKASLADSGLPLRLVRCTALSLMGEPHNVTLPPGGPLIQAQKPRRGSATPVLGAGAAGELEV